MDKQVTFENVDNNDPVSEDTSPSELINNGSGSVTLSKEIIHVLVQLINIAQKRGAYSMEESYLAYSVFRKFLNDPKFDKIEELLKNMDNNNKE